MPKFAILVDEEFRGEVDALDRADAELKFKQMIVDLSVEVESICFEIIEIIEAAKPKMLPMAKGTCIQCGTDHRENDPHNFFSISYQMRFRLTHGRDATHADTIAHLPEHLRRVTEVAIKRVLKENGKKWSEPVEGNSIAEKYVVSSGGDQEAGSGSVNTNC